jgi:hypothetical protein
MQKFTRDVDQNGSVSTKGRLTRAENKSRSHGSWRLVGDVSPAAELFSKFTQIPGNKLGEL